MFYVYVIFRRNGIPCYIGKGQGRRWLKRRTAAFKNPHLTHILKNANGNLPRLILRDGLTENEAFATEIAFIAAIGREPYGPLVNLTDGGEGVSGHRHSEETKKLFTQQRLGKSINKGRVFTEEHKQKLRLAKLGTHQSPEHREKIRQGNLGKYVPPEVGRKISLSKMGHTVSEETRRKISETKRARRDA